MVESTQGVTLTLLLLYEKSHYIGVVLVRHEGFSSSVTIDIRKLLNQVLLDLYKLSELPTKTTQPSIYQSRLA